MIKLDEEAILKKVDEIRAEKADSKELLALIGGDELEKIFEKYSIEAIIDTLIQEKKTHSLYEDDENGLTELEGLLNKKITGKLGKFYMMKPEYIISLPPEEQEHMAESISEGNIDLKNALMTLWKNGIETKACGGVRTKEEETPYIYVNVSLKNSDILGRLNNITQKGENYLDLCFDAGDDSLDIVIKGENVYQDVVEEFQKEPPKKNILDFLADEQLLTSTVLAKHIENNQQLKYTEKDVEEIVLDTAKEHKEQADRNEALLRERYENEIRRLSKKLEEEKKENEELSGALEKKQEEKENLQQKYDKLYETHGRLKNFIVHKIGKIPFLGRRVLKLMETEEKALPEGKDDTERE